MQTRFVLKSVSFDEGSWRKLSGLSFSVAPRMTVIAGHNGIGKSSILGFIANCSEAKISSVFGTKFGANFQEIFKLSPQDVSTGGTTPKYVRLTYGVRKDEFVKVCNIGQNSDKRYRVVPRNRNKKEPEFGVGPDAKVPMPTIYVGLTRLVPFGEISEEQLVVSKKHKRTEVSDYLREIIDKIIPYETRAGAGSTVEVKGIGARVQRSMQPEYSYPAETVSVGQGALGSIVTALASFDELKRSNENYCGGILLIDEVDAGLHPKAQMELAKVLLSEAQRLSLQVIVTTHALPFIEAVYKGIGKAKNPRDKLLYIRDTRNPVVCETMSLDQIRDEMYLGKAPKNKKTPILQVYVEDAEAHRFLTRILRFFKEKYSAANLRLKVEIVEAGLGSHQLIRLVKDGISRHFSTEAVIVLDGDVSNQSIQEFPNVVKLPTESGGLQNPEKVLDQYVRELVDGKRNGTLIRLRDRGITSDKLCSVAKEYVELVEVNEAGNKTRVCQKDWMKKMPARMLNAVIDEWLKDHLDKCQTFSRQFDHAIEQVRRNCH